jgi:(R,R)-butanediol dehydrogenase / meso-butanediol dehydrogenase / diacetyl reductase
MRAAVYRGPGDVRVADVPEPKAPDAGEAIVRVRRAAICGTDAAEWDHGPLLARPPVTLGHEFTGDIVDLGSSVGSWKVGDRVVSGAGVSCGVCEWCRRGRTNLCARYETLGLHVDGGLAEYVRVPVSTLVGVPEDLSDDAAAIAQPLAVALHAVRRSRVVSGDSCVVLGVGGIGAFIVAGAAARGIASLIAMDIDDARLAVARSLGATEHVNVRDRDLVEAMRDATGGLGPDVIVEATGASEAPAAALKAVKRGGRVLLVGLQAAPRQLDLLGFTVNEVELTTTLAHVCGQDLPEAVDILGRTEVAVRTIDRTIPLSELVECGLKPLVERTAKGKILVDPWA